MPLPPIIQEWPFCCSWYCCCYCCCCLTRSSQPPSIWFLPSSDLPYKGASFLLFIQFSFSCDHPSCWHGTLLLPLTSLLVMLHHQVELWPSWWSQRTLTSIFSCWFVTSALPHLLNVLFRILCTKSEISVSIPDDGSSWFSCIMVKSCFYTGGHCIITISAWQDYLQALFLENYAITGENKSSIMKDRVHCS